MLLCERSVEVLCTRAFARLLALCCSVFRVRKSGHWCEMCVAGYNTGNDKRWGEQWRRMPPTT